METLLRHIAFWSDLVTVIGESGSLCNDSAAQCSFSIDTGWRV